MIATLLEEDVPPSLSGGFLTYRLILTPKSPVFFLSFRYLSEDPAGPFYDSVKLRLHDHEQCFLLAMALRDDAPTLLLLIASPHPSILYRHFDSPLRSRLVDTTAGLALLMTTPSPFSGPVLLLTLTPLYKKQLHHVFSRHDRH